MVTAVQITPDAIYDDGVLIGTLGLTESAIRLARKSGKLRYTRQGKRTLYMGSWIIAWLQSEGEPQGVSHVQ